MKLSILRLGFLKAMVIVCYSCSPKDDQLVFKPVPRLNYSDSAILPKDSSKTYSRVDHFIIEGYHDNKLTNLKIDKFAFSLGRKLASKYESFSVLFFKESKETTVENIANNKHIVDRYSIPEDLVAVYNWYRGNIFKKEMWENGVEMDFKDDIKVEDVK